MAENNANAEKDLVIEEIETREEMWGFIKGGGCSCWSYGK